MSDDDEQRIRKRAVSIRMSGSDVRKVKALAERFGVRESDVIRYAVKSMLQRLAPLYDSEVVGRSLVPVFVEAGDELVRFFDLDALRLDKIINGGANGPESVDSAERVEYEDVRLLAMNSLRRPFVRYRLGLPPQPEALAEAAPPDDESGTSGTTYRALAVDGFENPVQSLHRYLYEKYVFA